MTSTSSDVIVDSSSPLSLPSEIIEELVPQYQSALVEKHLKTIQVCEVPLDCQPCDVLDVLLGEASASFLEDCAGHFTKYGDALANAVDIFSPELVHRYNLPETVFELNAYENCDESLPRRNSTIDILLKNAGTHVHYLRRRVCAKIISTIHVLKTLFKKPEWTRVLGTRDQMLSRLPDRYHDSIKEIGDKDRYVLGYFDHWDAIVYEILCLLAYNDLRFSVCTGHIDALLSAEYHIIRPAVDAIDGKILNICLLSVSYFSTVWTNYMRIYYPSIFRHRDKDDEDSDHLQTLTPPEWTRLRFYLPDKDTTEVLDHDELLVFLVGFFQETLTEDFRFAFKTINVPTDFSMLITEVFEKERRTSSSSKRPKRACVRSPVVDLNVRQRRH